MSFRVTGTMMFNRLMSNMGQATKTMADLQEQMVSLRRLNRPSDDPIGASRAQLMRSSENDYKLYTSNMEQARSLLDFTAGVLETMSAEVVNVRGKLLSAISPTADAISKEVIAAEIDDILRSLMAEANSNFGGMYIFGGTQTESAPFEITREGASGVETVVFSGDSGRIRYLIGPNNTMEVNEDPVEVFMPRGEAKGLFNTLIGIRKLLQNPDNLSDAAQASLLSDKIKEIDDVHNDLVRSLGRAGTRSRSLQMRADLYSQAEISLIERRSEIEDADIADVALRLQNQQTILEVVLASSAAVYNSNLMQFLK
ncbi:MAG TPA: flagellar hook-associated protein FlgL [Planctomycetota bacterium]|nr:flagellar hook-associated protein FlgL [Planctomycetota bacterium]